MIRDTWRRCTYKLSRVGRRVDQLWALADHPRLICVLEIRHAISNDSERVEIVVTESKAEVWYQEIDHSGLKQSRATSQPSEAITQFVERIESLGIFEHNSAEQGMFDGSNARIAARNPHFFNVFGENSLDTPQARTRAALLELARPSEKEAEAAP